MLTRDQVTILVLAIFGTQLLVNVFTLSLVLYKVMKMNEFFRWSKDYLIVAKQYVDLLDAERGRIRHVVEQKATEIKEEIRESALTAKANAKAENEGKNGA